jgi:hypothetical protein
MANDISEHERRAKLRKAALDNIVTVASSAHPVPASVLLQNETERVHKIVVSNLAVKDD